MAADTLLRDNPLTEVRNGNTSEVYTGDFGRSARTRIARPTFSVFHLTGADDPLVEAAAIVRDGLANLTIRVAGCHASSLEQIGSQEIIPMLTPKPVEVRH